MRWSTSIAVATPVLCTGLTALFCEHLQLASPFAEGIHVLFGGVTSTAIAAVLICGAQQLADRPAGELYRFTRQVSRWVYVLLYVLAIVRVGFYLMDESYARVGHRLHHAAVRSPDDFQLYLWCCIIPLWSIRAWVHSALFRVR